MEMGEGHISSSSSSSSSTSPCTQTLDLNPGLPWRALPLSSSPSPPRAYLSSPLPRALDSPLFEWRTPFGSDASPPLSHVPSPSPSSSPLKALALRIETLIHHPSSRLLQIHALLLKSPPHRSRSLLRRIVLLLLPRSLAHARSLFDRVVVVVASPDPFLYSALIRAHLCCGAPSEALSLFRRMRLHHHPTPLDSFALSSALQACARSNGDRGPSPRR